MNQIGSSAAGVCCLCAGITLAGAQVPQQRALNDAELRAVSAQMPAPLIRVPARSLNGDAPLLPGLYSLFGSRSPPFGELADLQLPLFGWLHAAVSSKDVLYGPNAFALRANADGAYNLPLPISIGELDWQNIRVGANDSANFGSVQIKGIDLSRTVITLTPNR